MVVQRNTGDWRPPAINNNWNCINVVGYGGLKDDTVLPTYIHFKISLYLVKDRWLHIFIIIKCNFQHNETYLFFLNPLCFKSSWAYVNSQIDKKTKPFHNYHLTSDDTQNLQMTPNFLSVTNSYYHLRLSPWLSSTTFLLKTFLSHSEFQILDLNSRKNVRPCHTQWTDCPCPSRRQSGVFSPAFWQSSKVEISIKDTN